MIHTEICHWGSNWCISYICSIFGPERVWYSNVYSSQKYWKILRKPPRLRLRGFLWIFHSSARCKHRNIPDLTSCLISLVNLMEVFIQSLGWYVFAGIYWKHNRGKMRISNHIVFEYSCFLWIILLTILSWPEMHEMCFKVRHVQALVKVKAGLGWTTTWSK